MCRLLVSPDQSAGTQSPAFQREIKSQNREAKQRAKQTVTMNHQSTAARTPGRSFQPTVNARISSSLPIYSLRRTYTRALTHFQHFTLSFERVLSFHKIRCTSTCRTVHGSLQDRPTAL